MCLLRTYVASILSLILAFPLMAQQSSSTTQSSPQAISLLHQSLAALTGGQPVTDVTLSGTVRRIAGSDDETGTAILKAASNGSARLDFNFSSGPYSETANFFSSPAGSWSGPDGVSHSIVFHNLLSEAAWFFPAFAVGRRLSTSGYVATYIDHETHEGQAVEHVSVSQNAPIPNPPGGVTFEHLTRLDFYLDSTMLLPAAVTFSIHADNDALLDIPVEVRFSDYRSVNGAQVPFHMQKFLNNSLFLDFQAQAVTPNSGLTAAAFIVEGN